MENINFEPQCFYNLLVKQGVEREQTLESLFRSLELQDSESPSLLKFPPQKLQNKHSNALEKWHQELMKRDDQFEGLILQRQRISFVLDELQVLEALFVEAIRRQLNEL